VIATMLASMLFAAPLAGAHVYETRCASCHGAQMWGGADGPSLRGVGLAAVDFYLTTGRMPAAVPNVQIGDRDERSGQRLSQDEIRALEAYLAPVVAGGPAIPGVIASGDRAHGRALFSLHCAQCHGFNGEGGAIGQLAWAPSLRDTPIDAVAEAIRVGPGEMPQFGEHQLSQNDLDDVASYVVRLSAGAQPHDAPPLRSSGPVPEGAVGYLAVIVLVAFVFTFWRVDTPRARREEAVRRDEGGDT
jgi:ubiquinol-cytochrome c reductase cytochrome c subunit